MIDLNKIHLYKWDSLYWFEYEINIGFSAISNLISNQEEVYVVKQIEFVNNRDEILPTVPEEYRDAYEQHFFEDADRTFNELKLIQRNSICLSYFSFVEGKLIELLKMMEKEFKIEIDIPKSKILPTIQKIIETNFEVNNEIYLQDFARIINQLAVRNSIAHNQSVLKHKKYFPKTEGLELRGLKVIVSDIRYLENLVEQGERFFKNLFISVDKRLTLIKAIA